MIAKVRARDGHPTVGVVTKPFQFEGSGRMRVAEQGIADLQQSVDTLIVIPNQNLFRVANEKTTSPTPSPWPTRCSIRASPASPI